MPISSMLGESIEASQSKTTFKNPKMPLRSIPTNKTPLLNKGDKIVNYKKKVLKNSEHSTFKIYLFINTYYLLLVNRYIFVCLQTGNLT